MPDVSPADLAGKDPLCIVCLEDLHTNAKRLKCGHMFHLHCLRRWLETNAICPTCRERIRFDEERRDRRRNRNARLRHGRNEVPRPAGREEQEELAEKMKQIERLLKQNAEQAAGVDRQREEIEEENQAEQPREEEEKVPQQQRPTVFADPTDVGGQPDTRLEERV